MVVGETLGQAAQEGEKQRSGGISKHWRIQEGSVIIRMCAPPVFSTIVSKGLNNTRKSNLHKKNDMILTFAYRIFTDTLTMTENYQMLPPPPTGSLDGSFLIIFSVKLKVDSWMERREPIKMPCPINTWHCGGVCILHNDITIIPTCPKVILTESMTHCCDTPPF